MNEKFTTMFWIILQVNTHVLQTMGHVSSCARMSVLGYTHAIVDQRTP